MSQPGRIPHSRALPNHDRAVILQDKLEAYVLDPTHPDGKHKAIVFKSALGFEQSQWDVLRDAIMAELPYHEAIVGRTDKFGQRYNVTMPITGPNGRTLDVLTAWIVDTGAHHPRFVTAKVQ